MTWIGWNNSGEMIWSEWKKNRKDEQQRMEQQRKDDQDHFLQLLKSTSSVGFPPADVTATTPKFAPFDSTTELWTDYYDRFCTFVGAHYVPEDSKPQVFLTNQTATTYKLLANLASQLTPAKDINVLTMKESNDFMKDQFDPNRA